MNDWFSTFIEYNCCPICKKSTVFKRGFKKDNTIVLTNVKNTNDFVIWGQNNKPWKANFYMRCNKEHMIKYKGVMQFVEFIPEYEATYEVGWNGAYYLNKLNEKLHWQEHDTVLKVSYTTNTSEIHYNEQIIMLDLDSAIKLRESDDLDGDIEKLMLFV